MIFTCYACDFQEEITFVDALRSAATGEKWWKTIDISDTYINDPVCGRAKVWKSKHLCIKCQDIEEILT